MTNLAFTILVPKLLKSQQEGQQFLEAFLRHLPNYVPERCGRHEPLRKKFNPKRLDLALLEWGPHDFIAERWQPRLLLQVNFGMESIPVPRHTMIHVHHLEAPEWAEVVSLRNYLVEAADILGADLVVAHILTKAELKERIDYLRTLPGTNPEYMMQRAQQLGEAQTLNGMTVMQFNTKNLRVNLPDFPWLTIFGRPYVEMFGRERIETAPAHEVRPLSNGSILVNLTGDIPDSPDGWANFKAARDRCKAHLNSNAFFDPNLPPGHAYRVPEFRFPLEMYKAKTLA